MSGEIRVLAEGTLRGVQASGSGRTWATATSPISALYPFVQDGFSFTSAQTTIQVMERGVPDHHKVVEKAAIDVTFSNFVSYQTGQQVPLTLATSSGTTVIMQHLEYKSLAAEIGNGTTAMYYQFNGVIPNSFKYTENKNGNKMDFTFKCLSMTGPTGSGFLS